MDLKGDSGEMTIDPSGIIMKNATGVETIKIDGANGTVGIGTSAPEADLHIHNSGPESIIKVSDNGIPSLGVKIISKNYNSTDGAGSIEFVEGVDGTGIIDYGFAMGYNGGYDNHLYNWPINTFNIARFNANTTPISVISIERTTGDVDISSGTLSIATSGDIKWEKGSTEFLRVGTPANANANYQEVMFIYRPRYDMNASNQTEALCVSSWVIGTSYSGYDADSFQQRTNHGGFGFQVPTGKGFSISTGAFNESTRRGGLHCSTYKDLGANGDTGNGKYYIRYSGDAGARQVLYTSDNWNADPYRKVGIYSPHMIWAEHYVIASDRRIKTEIESLDDTEALEIVNKLECVKYHYKCKKKRKENKTIGFIAQDVREHLPEATTIRTEFIPNDELIECDDWDEKILTVNVSWEDNNTGILKFVVANNDEEDEEEIDLKCEMEDGNKTNKFMFEKKYDNVLWIKTEVDDFIVIDKNQIFALHHGAIQELSRKNDTLVAENTALKIRMDAMDAAIIVLQNK